MHACEAGAHGGCAAAERARCARAKANRVTPAAVAAGQAAPTRLFDEQGAGWCAIE